MPIFTECHCFYYPESGKLCMGFKDPRPNIASMMVDYFEKTFGYVFERHYCWWLQDENTVYHTVEFRDYVGKTISHSL